MECPALKGLKNRFFLLLKPINKLSKNKFTKLHRTIISIFANTRPKAEERRVGVRVLGQTRARAPNF